VFGRVASGMDVVKRMLAMPTSPGGDEEMKGQMLVHPITIVRAVRLDGTPKPTGRPKVWIMFKGL
jgi:peptidyl-prolyl cis-trans isomerase A (cyclophilin A)